MNQPVIKEIAAALGTSLAQVLLRWGLDRCTSVIPKSVTLSRVHIKFDLLELSADQFPKLTTIKPQIRMLRACFWLQPAERRSLLPVIPKALAVNLPPRRRRWVPADSSRSRIRHTNRREDGKKRRVVNHSRSGSAQPIASA